MSNIFRPLLSDYVQMESHIADDVVLMKDTSTLAAFSCDGLYPDTADQVDVNSWYDRLHTALRNVAAEDIEINVYQCRGDADRSVAIEAPHRRGFAADFAHAYTEGLFRNGLYQNSIVITVQIHLLPTLDKAVQGLVAAKKRTVKADIEARVVRLNEICGLLQAHLRAFNLIRLGYVERGPWLFDEIAEALVFAMTGVYRQIGATAGRMGNAMFSESVRFRKNRVEIGLASGETVHAAVFGMREYPARTGPEMFDALLTAPYRCTLAQSFRFLSHIEADTAISRKQNKMVLAGDKAFSQIEELTYAADDLLSRKWVLGMHSAVLIAFADSVPDLAIVGTQAYRDLSGCGLVAVRIQMSLQAAYVSMLPGNSKHAPRPGVVKSTNYCAMAPLYAFPAGERSSKWGPPICLFRTAAGTPFWFHWHSGDVGNALITGATGSGKSLLAGALLAFTSGRARVVALDHKRGWDHLIHAMNGSYTVLGARQPNFAPLKALDASPVSLDFLTGLVRGCVGGVMTEEDGRRLTVGLRTVMAMPAHLRSMGEVRAFFDEEPEGAGTRLEKWCAGNELGWVLDAPQDTVQFGDLTGLDVTALLDNERARAPALGYLFHRVSAGLDGTPTMLAIDEGWRALVDPTFRAMIEKSLRTIRSKNGIVVFITQSPGDIVESGMSRALLEMCQTQFHLPNSRGRKDDYIFGFGITDGAWEAFRQLQGGMGHFLLCQADKSVVAQLPMRGAERFISTLSATEIELQRGDRDRAEMEDAL